MRRAMALGAALLLAGCAAEPCDPRRDTSIFQVAGCTWGGGYDSRVATLQADLDRAEADVARARAERDRALGGGQRVAAERASLRMDLANNQARALRLERDIAAAREQRSVNERRAADLQREAASLRAQADQLRNAEGDPALRQRLDAARAREAALDREWRNLLEASPRD
jgi:chromosome segregation ATPase